MLQLVVIKNPFVRSKLGLAPEKILKKKTSSDINMLENKDTLQQEIVAETLSPDKLLDVSV